MGQPNSVKDMNAVLELARKESDRGFFITMGSYLEEVSRELVVDLIDPKKFNSFAKLIDIACKEDRITQGMAELLHLVREIRNCFAHRWDVYSLADAGLQQIIDASKSFGRNIHKNLEADLIYPNPLDSKSYLTSLMAYAAMDIMESIAKRSVK